jgi:oxygen-independent coproporphyrinogen-3 oxidase
VAGRTSASPAPGAGVVPLEARAPVALYVHIPFCLSVCPYCDFVVYGGAAARGSDSRIPLFVNALHAELDLRAEALDRSWPGRAPLETVYFGGGTPSLLPAEVVAGLLEHVRRRFGLAAGAEVSLEANPGIDDRGDLAGFAAAGVRRVSFGAQSLDAGELRAVGRRHRPLDVVEAIAEARRAGIASINLDLLYDLPRSSLAGWERTLATALSLGPDHLSLYALTLDDPDAEGLTGASGDHLPVSRGARAWRTRARKDQDDDRAADQYRLAVDRLGAAGYRGYEISNWARPGHESRHNLAYWERRPYEAVGPGAHAFDGRIRRWNAARLGPYVVSLAPGPGRAPGLPPGGFEVLNPVIAAAETAILGLRLDGGLSRVAAEAGPLAPHLEWAVGQGLLTTSADGERIALTMSGRLLSNELFARLL